MAANRGKMKLMAIGNVLHDDLGGVQLFGVFFAIRLCLANIKKECCYYAENRYQQRFEAS
jgi:hypothetical protein